MSTLRNDVPVSLTFFPDRRGPNPYQTVLYRALGPTVRALPGMIDAPKAPTGGASARKDGRDTPVFHLHWEEAILSDAQMTAERFLDALARFRDCGGRFVWTVHNAEPHDPDLRPFVRDLRPGLLDLADAVHVHSPQALAMLAEAWGTVPRRARIIPHPNYDGCYPVLDRGAARDALGVQGARIVMLAPGRIAPYKRTGALITAFRQAAGPDDVLLIAGAPARGQRIEDPDDSRIRIMPDFATPEAFAQLHAACDVVVLPYTASLTSGSAILAATLGRGVLGADTAGLRDAVQPGLSGVLFEAKDDAALAVAIATALAEGAAVWAERGRRAAQAARGRSPAVIGTMWQDLLRALGTADHAMKPRPACA